MSSLCVLPSVGARTVPCACERRLCPALLCIALQSSPFGTSCTVCPCEARKGCDKRSAALHCSTLQSSTILSPRDVAAPFVAASYPVATARKQAMHCRALPCTALLCGTIQSLLPNAVNLCSHFFRLACFKPCQVVASKLGAVVAKPFKHGRMHKRILHIGHVQYFGNDRH